DSLELRCCMNRSVGRHILWVVGLMGALIFGRASVAAQSTGSLQGTVEDTSGAIMPGVTVTVTNVGTALERTVETDANGLYLVGLNRAFQRRSNVGDSDR